MSALPPAFMAQVQPLGQSFAAPADKTLLAAARNAGIDLPASCRNGTCRTCMCRLSSGRIAYRIEWPGLTREEKDEGYILPCVAHAETDVVIHVPGARPLASG
ncbi:MAG TPA: 2Fe-2S iron-sulfur cluster-binding protein [Noviherbaspirillum sp.]|uniref:2Fe-2S iron-sulfur cluster-binding protein n=1 Tax=Noviherbaspirillum sp. TaxID=1926288 RepID=UPI002D27632D|nr:2Fe-2S iron-sulfur cluster-binding protein [Noviherbaspirillum sp.]HYD94896.1 2Fe-2S iron-sulfur cluster-binding protein [Noviherbaspirillum sp.]